MSSIDICNIAVGRIGGRPIRSFSDDNKIARQCELAYNTYLEDLQSKYDWTFCTGYEELAMLSETGTDELPYVYALPADCLRVREVRPRSAKINWIRVGNKIYANSDAVTVLYSAKITDTGQFAGYFKTLMAAAVAQQIAMPLTQNVKISSKMETWFETMLIDALEVDASTNYEYRTPNEDPNNDTFVNPDGDLES